MSHSRRNSAASSHRSEGRRRPPSASSNEIKGAYLTILKDVTENITTRQQLTQVIQYAGKNPSAKEVSKIWSENAGSISYEKACSVIKRMKDSSRSDLLAAFKRIDINSDGFITENELYRVLTTKGEKMTHTEVKQVLDSADANKDGKLDYFEFCDMMLSTCNRMKKLNAKKIDELKTSASSPIISRSQKQVVSPNSRRNSERISNGITITETTNEDADAQSVRSVSVRSVRSLGKKDDDEPVPVPRKEKPKADDQEEPVQISTTQDSYIVKGPAMTEYKMASLKPKSLKGWTHATSKGCFFVNEDNVITSHVYTLELPFASNVWLTIKTFTPSKDDQIRPSSIDTGVFIYRDTGDGELTDLVATSEVKEGKEYVWRGDLRSGTYKIVPYSTGCRLKCRGPEVNPEMELTRTDQNNELQLTRAARDAMGEIFDLVDLDSDGLLNRSEFNWFQMMLSDEDIDDESWQVVLDNVETENDCLTKEGFIELHLMQAQDEDVDPQEELIDTVRSMGYSGTLSLDQAAPFIVDVYTKDSKCSLSVSSLSEPDEDPIQAGMQQNVLSKKLTYDVPNLPGLVLHYFASYCRVSAFFENTTSKDIQVHVSSTESKNISSHRGKDHFVVDVSADSFSLLDHIIPAFEKTAWTYHCQLSNRPATRSRRKVADSSAAPITGTTRPSSASSSRSRRSNYSRKSNNVLNLFK